MSVILQSDLRLSPSLHHCKNTSIQILFNYWEQIILLRFHKKSGMRALFCMQWRLNPLQFWCWCVSALLCTVFNCMTVLALTCCSLCSLLTKEIIMSCQHFEGWRQVVQSVCELVQRKSMTLLFFFFYIYFRSSLMLKRTIISKLQ